MAQRAFGSLVKDAGGEKKSKIFSRVNEAFSYQNYMCSICHLWVCIQFRSSGAWHSCSPDSGCPQE